MLIASHLLCNGVLVINLSLTCDIKYKMQQISNWSHEVLITVLPRALQIDINCHVVSLWILNMFIDMLEMVGIFNG